MTDLKKKEFNTSAEVIKVDSSLGIVLGFAIICKKEGEPYFDLHGDYIPEESMLKASLEFMENSQIGKDMHSGDQTGSIVFAWPMTEDIAKAFDIVTKNTGLMIAYKPSSEDILQKFQTGEYRGFSIGGKRIAEEEVE